LETVTGEKPCQEIAFTHAVMEATGKKLLQIRKKSAKLAASKGVCPKHLELKSRST
jgi:hypothetical protein